MESTKYLAKIKGVGFEPGKDISDVYWNIVTEQFMMMYNQYAYMTNQIIDRLNDNWRRYESIRRIDEAFGKKCSTIACQEAMGIHEDTTYGDWLERWFKECCEAVDMTAAMSGFLIRSDIHRVDDLPMFGAKFVNKPEWRMEMVLEEQ